MKVGLLSLLSITFAVCELPPPYLNSGFRPQPFSSPFRNQLQTNYGPPKPPLIPSSPQTQYGPPKSVEFFNEKFRPSDFPERFKQNQILPPRTNYGVPVNENIIRPQNTFSTSNGNFNFPKFSSIRNGPRIVNQHQNVPQTIYGAPSKFIQTNFASNSIQQKAPQVTYGAPSSPQQSIPQPVYNAPAKFSQNNQEFPKFNYVALSQQQNFGSSPTLPQNSYNVPINSPETQFRDPNTNNIETLNRLKALISVFDKAQLNTQYLPAKGPSNFQTSSGIFSQSLPSQQSTNFRDNSLPQQQNPLPQHYIPVKEATDFRKGFEWTQNIHNTGGIPAPIIPTHLPGNNLDLPQSNGFSIANQNNVEIQQLDVRTLYPPLGTDDSDQNQADVSNQSQLRSNDNPQTNGNLQENKYLTSTSTSSPVVNRPIITTTTGRPETTLIPNEVQVNDDQKPPSTEVNVASGPNVAVATAVAGAQPEQQFYLVQPDGRLQRVVYQQTKQPGDAENEYVADYYFQNIQTEPNVVYAPLITLG